MAGKARPPLVISDIAVAEEDCTGDVFTVLAGYPYGHVSPEKLLSQSEKLRRLWRQSEASAALKLKCVKALDVVNPAALIDFYSLLPGALQVSAKIRRKRACYARYWAVEF